MADWATATLGIVGVATTGFAGWYGTRFQAVRDTKQEERAIRGGKRKRTRDACAGVLISAFDVERMAGGALVGINAGPEFVAAVDDFRRHLAILKLDPESASLVEPAEQIWREFRLIRNRLKEEQPAGMVLSPNEAFADLRRATQAFEEQSRAVLIELSKAV